MTVMLDSFFGLHQHVVRSGQWAKMKPGEKDLYVYLMEESERHRTRLIKATDPAIQALVGAAPRTLCNARKKLREYGLILYKAEQGNRYAYTICNPRTGTPYPGDPKDRVDGAKRTPVDSQEPIHVNIAPGPPLTKPRREDAPIESYGLSLKFDSRSSKTC